MTSADLLEACNSSSAAGPGVLVSPCSANSQDNLVRTIHSPLGAEVTNSVTVYTADGWAIHFRAGNYATKETGSVRSAQPPFTTTQLLDLALNPVWFGN